MNPSTPQSCFTFHTVVQSWLENSFTLYYCTTGQLVGHLSGLSMSPINYPLINGCHYQSVYLCEHYCFIYCNYRQEKYLHYNFKTPTPAQTRNAGTSAGIFEHNPHFGFEIPSLKPITHNNVLCTTLKVFQ